MDHDRRTLLVYPLLLITVAFAAPARATGFLHARGQEIVDEKGQTVLLRGVGLGNWMLPEGYMWKFGGSADRPRRIEQLVKDLIGEQPAERFWMEYRRNYITEADIRRIAELGFNSVRPALDARLFLTEDDTPQYLHEGFELLDNLVAWCGKHGVYVIIDMHAAPGGQTGANIDDSRNDQPELFIDMKNQDRLVALWTRIASRYKDNPTVAAFDLLNEPLPQRTGARAKYGNQLEPLYKRITAAIREVDKRHLITVEGADWANDWAVFSRPFDSNLVYQFHYYCWDRPDALKGIGQYLAARNRFNRPVWAGETGEKDNAIYWATTEYFEFNHIGWSFWPWKKMAARNAPLSIKAPEGWQTISAYSRGRDKPPPDVSAKAFEQLLHNVRIENCVFFPDVVSAIMRRVPGRVEAENFDHGTLGRSFFVQADNAKSKYYRTTEPVPIEPVEGGSYWSSEQAIVLKEREWTTYTVNSLTSADFRAVVRVKVDQAPAVFELSVNGKAEDVTASADSWAEVQVKPIRLAAGPNRLKLLVKSGAAHFDWFQFE